MTQHQFDSNRRGFRHASRLLVMFAALLLTVAGRSAAHAESRDELAIEVQAALQRVSPSVVRIRILGSSTADDSLSVSSQVTTGVVVSAEGQILTSTFGLQGEANAILVETSDGNRANAEVLASDHVRKLVLLKCDGLDFVVPEFSAEPPPVGAWAIAAGRLYSGNSPSGSLGIISAVNRIHGLALQTDAKVSPVNYGGPLIDLDGRVQGILVPLSPQDSGRGIQAGVEWYDSGIGFAIPAQDALQVAQELTGGRDRVHGIAGLAFDSVNPLESDFKVTKVHPESPADSAGIQSGDQLLVANDTTIDRFGILQSIVKSSYAGDILKLKVRRQQTEFETDLVLADRLKVIPRGYLGIIPWDVVKDAEEEFAGLEIIALPDQPAARAGLTSRSIITSLSVNGQNEGNHISSHAAMLQTLAGLHKGQEITFKFRSARDANEASATVVAEQMPDSLPKVPMELLWSAAVPKAGSWNRSEHTLEENGRVWFFSPNKSEPASERVGAVVLLSAHGKPPQSVIREWRQLCIQFRLALVVPSNPETAPLSNEDLGLLMASVEELANQARIDSERLILVAESPQASLATRAVFHPRLGIFRSAVFIACRPSTTDVPDEFLQERNPAFLFLADSQSQSKQSRALLSEAASQLLAKGLRVTSVESSDVNASFVTETISDWSVQIRIR